MTKSEQTVRLYVEAYNTFNLKKMMRNLNDSLCYENFNGGELTLSTNTLAHFKIQAQKMMLVFEKRKLVIEQLTELENEVSISFTSKEIFAIDINEDIVAGDVITMSGETIFTFKEKEIIKIVDRT